MHTYYVCIDGVSLCERSGAGRKVTCSVYSITPASGEGERNPGGPVASAERELGYQGSGGGAPSRVQGQRPWWGVRRANPPEAESFWALELPREQQNLPRFPYSAVFHIIIILYVNRW